MFPDRTNSPCRPESSGINSSDLLLSHFTEGGDQGNAMLDQFVEQLDLLPYLEREPSEFKNWPGHPTLIAKIAAGNWKTEPLVKTSGGRLIFPDPGRHFDIHFELQAFVGKERLGLYLHYETRRYYSQAKLTAKADPGSLRQYLRFRDEFMDEFALHCQVPGFTLSREVLQIGKADCKFAGMSVAEASCELQRIIDETACAVNLALFRLEERRRGQAGTSSVQLQS